MPAEVASVVERAWWPAKVIDSEMPCFLVPIEPRWSTELFNVPAMLLPRSDVLGISREHVLLEAEERGLREVLEAEFPLLDDQRLVDALVWCDMTTSPDGDRTTAEARLAEIMGRYGTDSVVGRFIRRASPEILAAVRRVDAELEAQPR